MGIFVWALIFKNKVPFTHPITNIPYFPSSQQIRNLLYTHNFLVEND